MILNTYGVSKSSLHLTVDKNFSFGGSPGALSPANAPVSKLVTEPKQKKRFNKSAAYNLHKVRGSSNILN